LIFSGKNKTGKSCATTTGTKTPAKNNCPKLYLHNASYTQPVFSAVL